MGCKIKGGTDGICVYSEVRVRMANGWTDSGGWGIMENI